MNRPKATRLRLSLAVAAVAAFAAFLPATASADFGNYYGITGYPTTPTASNVTVAFTDPTPGAHSDIKVNHNYGYTGVPSGAANTSGDDLKQWILETPAGFYGNPSAIPFAKRCTQDQMNAYVKNQPMPGYLGYPGSRCPDSAQVGTAKLTIGVDASGATGTVLNGKIYVVQSANPLQEVPTTLFTVFETTVASCSSAPVTNCITAALSKTQIAPVTGGTDPDYRLRSVSELIDRPDLSGALSQAPHTTEGHIKGIEQILWGDPSANGNVDAVGYFQTNPTTCSNWESRAFSRTYGNAGTFGNETPVSTATQTNTLEGTASPGGGDTSGTYAEFDSPPTVPDCSGTLPALTQTASGSVDNNTRGANPGLTVNISNPGSDDVDKAKTLVTTLPSTITVNAAALGNICQDSDLQADTCPAASQVGTAEITSPILSATQYGRVYMTQGASKGLPFLSIWVNGPNDSPAGAFKFRLDATTRFVGATANMIETTFDKLPSLPFDSFKVKIDGGSSTNSLLLNRVCPGDGSSPEDGPITFSTSGYAGGSASASSPTNLDPCYGVSDPSNLSSCQTVTKKLKVSPKGLVAVNNIANVKLFTGSKTTSMNKRATDSKSPHKFEITLKKDTYKKNKTYYYLYKVEYKDGKILKTAAGTFKTCK